MAGKKGRSGRKKGYTHTPRERLQIQTGRLLQIAHDIAENKDRGDPKKLSPRVTMILGLLRKELPDKSANDVTSGGEPIVVVQRLFKRPEKNDKAENNDAPECSDGVPDPDAG
jgi:hypothetical protein